MSNIFLHSFDSEIVKNNIKFHAVKFFTETNRPIFIIHNIIIIVMIFINLVFLQEFSMRLHPIFSILHENCRSVHSHHHILCKINQQTIYILQSFDFFSKFFTNPLCSFICSIYIQKNLVLSTDFPDFQNIIRCPGSCRTYTGITPKWNQTIFNVFLY